LTLIQNEIGAMISANTNTSAYAALSTMRSTETGLGIISKRIQTGLRINDAGDDGAIFSIAQGVRANVRAYAAVQSSLAGGIGLGEVTLAAISGIYSVVGDIKAKIASLGDGSLAQPQLDTYRGDVARLIEQVNTYIGQATYNGRNILRGDATNTPIDFIADISGTQLSYSVSHSLSLDADEFLGPSVLVVSATDVSEAIGGNPPDIATAQDSLARFEAQLMDLGQVISAQKRAMEAQRGFVDNLVDAMKQGLGLLIDADVAAESASLQSRQVAQQLTMESLSIANRTSAGAISLLLVQAGART
jgi:flagellin